MVISLPGVIVMPVLLWLALADLLYRRISNRLVLGLLLGWLACTGWSWLQGGGFDRSMLTGVAAALVILALGFGFFTMGWMGAGDVKSMAVLALWMGEQTYEFLVVTSLAGGALALMLPGLRRLEHALGLGLLRLNAWLPRARLPLPRSLQTPSVPGIPYGLAIAFGAAFTHWNI